MENTTVTGEYDIQLSFERLLGVHTEPSMGWGERIITRQSDKKFYSVAFSMMIRKLTPYLQNTLYMHGCHTNLSFGHHYGKAGVITYYFVRTRGCQKAVSLVWPGDHWLHWAQALPRGYTIRCHQTLPGGGGWALWVVDSGQWPVRSPSKVQTRSAPVSLTR